MFCDVGHLGFLFNTKKTISFVKDRPRQIPAKFAFKLFIGHNVIKEHPYQVTFTSSVWFP